MPSPPASAKTTILSPLRYPGAKRWLCAYIAETLQLNSLRPKLFVEPLAGGAGVAIQLLSDGIVEKIALGERDPLVASFWKTVFRDADWLIEQLTATDVTLENWDYFKKGTFRSTRDRALACIFLNRTSFSGIMADSAGSIGGRKQESEYKIDCRFNVETLTKRIRQASALGDRVLFVDNAAWKTTVLKVEKLKYKSKEVFYYLDPPFFFKAESLYRYYFENKDHKELHRYLMKLKQPWLLSYDKADYIIKLYSPNGYGPTHIDILYSIASSGTRPKVQEVIITNLKVLP
jgi:DNA adenine methylase